MDKFVVKGGVPLRGPIETSGAKNSALPALAATLLTDQPVVLRRIPHVRDVRTMQRLLVDIGATVDVDNGCVRIQVSRVRSPEAPYELVKTMRASSLVLGPLVARAGRARVSLPGGCGIGARPINLHLAGLEQLGAQIQQAHGYIEAVAPQGLRGAAIRFERITVTGTEDLIMAAVLAQGETVIENAAREPEVADLADLLIKMGARITGGDLTVTGCVPEHNSALITKLQAAGAEVTEVDRSTLRVRAESVLRSVDMSTAEYPGFATDLQAQYMALMTQAEGIAIIEETIFENRFMHAQELARMGANIRLEGNQAIVAGRKELTGAGVIASDLRASASLVLAALVARGETVIDRVYHIDRGYEKIEEKLAGVGAQIRRLD